MTLVFGIGGDLSPKQVCRQDGQALMDVVAAHVARARTFDPIPATYPVVILQGNLKLTITNDKNNPNFDYGTALVAVHGYRRWMQDKSTFQTQAVRIFEGEEYKGYLYISRTSGLNIA